MIHNIPNHTITRQHNYKAYVVSFRPCSNSACDAVITPYEEYVLCHFEVQNKWRDVKVWSFDKLLFCFHWRGSSLAGNRVTTLQSIASQPIVTNRQPYIINLLGRYGDALVRSYVCKLTGYFYYATGMVTIPTSAGNMVVYPLRIPYLNVLPIARCPMTHVQSLQSN